METKLEPLERVDKCVARSFNISNTALKDQKEIALKLQSTLVFVDSESGLKVRETIKY